MDNKFIFKLRVYIEDTDYGQMVYHANYLKYFERARSEWADQAGFGLDWQKAHKVFFVVHSAKIDFLKPARLFEELEVISRITSVGKASIHFAQYLRLVEDPDKILCKAEVRVATVNENTRACALPKAPFFDSMRRLLQ